MHTSALDLSTVECFCSSQLLNNFDSNRDVFNNYKQKELTARILTTFVLNLLKKAASLFLERKFKRFDGNPGDDGCQNTAIILQQFSKKNHKDLERLLFDLHSIQKIRNTKNQEAISVFNKIRTEIKMNKKIQYIGSCFLSATMRVKYAETEHGVSLTRCDMEKLGKLSKRINKLPAVYRRKIIETNQKVLSSASAEILYELSLQIPRSPSVDIIVEMLSPSHRYLYSPAEGKYEPKTFLCGFFAVKACLSLLLRNEIPIVIKSIEKENSSHYVYMQVKGKTYSIVENLKEDSFVVFEVVFFNTLENIKGLIHDVGFEKLILCLAACCDPYFRGSSIKDVTNMEAQNQIIEYRKKGQYYNQYLTVDHVYFTSQQEEMNAVK